MLEKQSQQRSGLQKAQTRLVELDEILRRVLGDDRRRDHFVRAVLVLHERLESVAGVLFLHADDRVDVFAARDAVGLFRRDNRFRLKCGWLVE